MIINILENFKNVLNDSKKYYKEGNGTDVAMIILEQYENNNYLLFESIKNRSSDDYSYLKENYPDVSEAKISHEAHGDGLSITINGHEYRYVSPEFSTDELIRKFNKIHSFSAVRALAWLKKNSINYYGSKNPDTDVDIL